MTIQFSTKIFSHADLHSAKHLKSSLVTLLGQATDCLVLAYSKTHLDDFGGSKAKPGLLLELDRLLGGSVTHANDLGDLDGKQASTCLLRAEKSWAPNGVKVKRVLLVGLGDLTLSTSRNLNAYAKLARAALKSLSGSTIKNAIWYVPVF